jgi:hypothetical protein
MINKYLEKHRLTSFKEIKKHITELKRNTKPNYELINSLESFFGEKELPTFNSKSNLDYFKDFAERLLEIDDVITSSNRGEKETMEGLKNAPKYYDNKKGSLYKVATERGWNPYLFDVVKRLERGGKKDPLRQEIEKTKLVLDLWLKEQENNLDN